ncbi:unnamed protein product [Symbiodinium sp. CCMP2592]|nr:unnamed protein product [Symbiodinium sp. CCMP2592]
MWSDWSSLPGRLSGNDYENHIRELLTGSCKDQGDKRMEQAKLSEALQRKLQNLKCEAVENAREHTGEALWKRLFGENDFNDGQTGKASVEIVMAEDKDVLQCLGAGAEMLLGDAALPTGTVVEVTVQGPLFYVKCFQLEKYLTICALQTPPKVPPAALLVINRKPIECRDDWMNAVEKFPNLQTLAQQGNFRIAYCPHSVHHAQYRQKMVEKDEIIVEKDEIIAQKDAKVCLLSVLLLCLLAWQILQKLPAYAVKGTDL